MFGKKKRNKFEGELADQQKQTNALLSKQLETAQTKSPLENATEKEQTDWITQTDSPDFDVTKTTGLSPYLNLYNRAKANDLSDETPLAPAASWGGTTNASLSEALKSQGARQREQDAAGGLQQGFGAKDAAMRGQTLPFLGHQQQRNLALTDALNNRSLNLYGMYGKSIATPSFLQQFLLAGAGAGGQIGAAYAGRPS